MTKEELLEKANSLPLAPGVYLMHGKDGEVIYVGKAKKLKNRVSQYFQDQSRHNEKTRAMVSQIDHFDVIVVQSEFEALVLECALIKRHQPRYNILLKDSKGYPYVRLSNEAYPKFSLASKAAEDGARYFGPFGGRFETRQALDAVCAALRLPTCSRKFPRDIGAERPCLNFHMGRCDGFCRPEMTAEEYQRRIRQASQMLEGKAKDLLREMAGEMEAEARQLNGEMNVAAELIQKCIGENARVAQNQGEYAKRYDALAGRFETAKARLEEVQAAIMAKQAQRKMMENFMDVLSGMPEQVDNFDEAAWYAMVNFVTVYGKEDVRFTFKNGMEIKA